MFTLLRENLTTRQAEIFGFLEGYLDENERAPTLQEICNHFGFSSLSSAKDHLRLIEKKGYIVREPRSSRSIRIVRDEVSVDSSSIVSVPLVGKIAAGNPMFALEEVTETLALPKSLFHWRDLFALRVTGDSMRASTMATSRF